MTSDAITLFPPLLTWAPVDAAINFTLSSKTSRGGYGIEGYGRIFKAVYMMGSEAPAVPGNNAGYTN